MSWPTARRASSDQASEQLSIPSNLEYEKVRAIGAIVALTLKTVAASVRAGITTAELDPIGAGVLKRNGARSSPPLVYGFPGALCISVNDGAIHGIPGDRAVQPGDLVKLVSSRRTTAFMPTQR